MVMITILVINHIFRLSCNMIDLIFRVFRILQEYIRSRWLNSRISKDINYCWQELPVDILEKIIHLLNLDDRVRLGIVSKHWRSIVWQKKFFLNMNPWLVAHGDPESHLEFFDFPDYVVYKIRVPEALEGASCRGSSKGWLLMTKNSWSCRVPKFFLFNPISGSHIGLPSIKTISSVRHDNSSSVLYDIRKMELSSSPTLENDKTWSHTIVAVLLDNKLEGRVLALCALGDDKWYVFDRFIDETKDACKDLLFSNGILYVLMQEKATGKENTIETRVVRIGFQDVVLKVIPQHKLSRLDILLPEPEYGSNDEVGELFYFSYLLDCKGELLIVHKILTRGIINGGLSHIPYVYMETYGFQVFRIDESSDNIINLTRCHKSGGNVLFVSRACSLAIPIRDLEGWHWKEDCVIFVDDMSTSRQYDCDPDDPCEWGVTSMENGRIRRLYATTKNPKNWFLPIIYK